MNKDYIFLFFFIPLFFIGFLFSNKALAAPVGFNYVKTLTINNSGLTNAVINIPVLVKLSSTTFDFTKTQTDGDDIVFYSGETALNFERERYNIAAQEGYFWVKIPSIAATGVVTFNMYYGNAGASDTSNAVATWNNSYLRVYHLADKVGDNSKVVDSTGNYEGIKYGGATPIENIGQIYKAQKFQSQTVDDIKFGNATSSVITVEAWHYFVDGAPADKTIIDKGYTSAVSPYYEYHLKTGNGIPNFYVTIGGVGYAVNSSVGASGTQFDSYVGRFDGSMLDLWVNGVQTASSTAMGGGTSITNYATDGYIGASTNYRTSIKIGLNNKIDEVRISSVARSNNYLKIAYKSDLNTLLTFGNEYPAVASISISYPQSYGISSSTISDFLAIGMNYEIDGTQAIEARYHLGTSSTTYDYYASAPMVFAPLNTSGSILAYKTQPLTASTTYWQYASLYAADGIELASSTPNYFITTGQTVAGQLLQSINVIGNALPTATSATEINTTCDPNSAWYEKGLCKMFSWLFTTFLKPSDGVLNKFSNLKNSLENKPPLGYFTAYKNEISTLGATTTDTLGLPDLSSFNTPLFNTIKNYLSTGLWIVFGISIFNRFKHFQL